MKLIGLLSFYDEPVADLVACITALHDAGVTELVAVDGAYALYPDGRPASPTHQHAAIVLACRQLGVGCTLHVPRDVWAGNEVAKRTFLFNLAHTIAEDGDWFWVQDADMVVTRHPDDLLDRLERTDCEVAKVEILDTVALRINIPNLPPRFEMCSLFRAQPITVGPHHAQYRAADGRYLWIGNGDDSPAPTLDLSDVVRVEHRPDQRPDERLQAKLGYYAQRDHARVERGDCDRCDAPAVRLVPIRWRLTTIGPVADWAEACEPCATRLERVSRRQLLQLGVDPDSVVVENRNGQAPAGMTA